MFPADVRAAGVDCLTSGTYKWLLGGFGVAPFFIRRELLERIRVDRLGALHVEKELGDHRYEIYRTAKKFEYATLPFAEVYQLGAALAYLERVGVERIERHTVALAHELREGLAALGFRLFTPPDNTSSIVSLHLDRNQARAREVLDKAGNVQVSFRDKGSQIRVSPALFNTRDEIRQFLETAKAFRLTGICSGEVFVGSVRLPFGRPQGRQPDQGRLMLQPGVRYASTPEKSALNRSSSEKRWNARLSNFSQRTRSFLCASTHSARRSASTRVGENGSRYRCRENIPPAVTTRYRT